MNRDRIEGHWKQVTGNARQSWAKLIGDPLGIITGIRQHQAEKTQEAFGISKDKTEAELVATQNAIEKDK